MLAVGDRFRFIRGACSFVTARGKPNILNDHVSWCKPTAKISRHAANAILSQLVATLACTIEISFRNEGFDFKFMTIPVALYFGRPPDFSLRFEEIRTALRAEEATEIPQTQDELISPHGIEALNWLFSALFNAEYRVETTDGEIRWIAPKKTKYSLIPPKKP